MALLFGALWGSFANVCIHRIPRRQSIVRPASHCPGCQAPIAAYDNVPLLGWLMLLGRCRRCKTRISPRYPLVELLGMLLAALVYARFVAYGSLIPGADGAAAGYLAAPWAVALSRFFVYYFFLLDLLVLSFIDIEHLLLPDRVTLPSMVVFFLLGRVLWWQTPSPQAAVPLFQAALGLVLGWLSLWLVSEGYFLLTKREGLGGGDGKLLGLIGSLLGVSALPYVLFIGSVAGLFVGVPLVILRRRGKEHATSLSHTPIVFGPFLALGAAVYLLFLLGQDTDALLLRALGPLFLGAA